MTFRRLSKGRSRNEGRESLLLNSEPAVDGFGGMKRGYRTASNSGSSSGGSASYEVSAATKNLSRRPATTTTNGDNNSRLAASDRFLPQHRPRGSPTPKEEIAPAEGVLQFVPAYEESAAAPSPSQPPANDTSWDAILDDGAAAFPPSQPRFSGTRSEVAGATSSSNSSRFRRKASSSNSRKSAFSSSARKSSESATEVMTSSSSSRTKGPRIARLASLFSSRTTSSSNNEPTTTGGPKRSPNTTTDSTVPHSPSRSSSSGEYVGWPGTQKKDGDTVAIQSSYEDSDIGFGPNNVSGMPFDEDEFPNPEEKAWMDSSAFQEISRVHSDPPGEKADDSFYLEGETAPPPAPHGVPMNRIFQNNNPRWEIDAPSPSRSSVSKTSSAYFDNDVRPMAFPSFEGRQQAADIMRGTAGGPPTEEALKVKNSLSPPHRTPSNAMGFRGLLDKTQEVPNLMDGSDSDSMASSRSSTVHSAVSGTPSGYNYNNDHRSRMGVTMPRVNEDTESDVFDEISKYSLGQSRYSSEVFDGISQSAVGDSKASLSEIRNTTSAVERRNQQKDPPQQQKGSSTNGMKLVLLGGGLTTIQTTATDFSNRIRPTFSDYDETLTNSDIDVPSFQEMAEAGRSVNDSASVIDMSTSIDPSDGQMSRMMDHHQSSTSQDDDSFQPKSRGWGNPSEEPQEGLKRVDTSQTSYQDDESAFFSDFYSGSEVDCSGDLSEYYVQPAAVKKLVRKYRRMCHQTISNCRDYDEADRAEDEKQAFALFEMRSRIMEKDIERGLERRGGTTVVDDMVLTRRNRRSMRIRDAVIVSKAWRDGASPRDVINTAHLTERAERAYYICKPNRNRYRSPNSSLNSSSSSVPGLSNTRFTWEEVTWIDDADFLQYKCPSLGARHLIGSEMFTIGDCQSILLKLTNESCMELRAELNEATARQIEAEELMREEGDFGDGVMTEAEMTYLTSMEEVKTISKRLVVAEKAFALVRDRIKNLVAKYESLLVKIDNEAAGAESVITGASSCYSTEYASHVSTDYDQEERAWHRRQQRAEISAELSAREALLERQQASYFVEEEKQRELERLHHRLAELQSEPSTTTSDRQRSALLAKAIATKRQPPGEEGRGKAEVHNQLKGGGVDSVKQRFRERMAARKHQNHSIGVIDENRSSPPAPSSDRFNKPYTRQETPRSRPANPHLAAGRQNLLSLAGEEMFQHLDFYERSLKAVEIQREGVR